ncbi:MAG: TIGR01777 family oxidoreductase [Gemmatimonadota bacterium]
MEAGPIAVTGSSGLIGSALVPALEARGHRVTRMVRGVHWDPVGGTIDLAALEEHQAVIHLAGESIAGLWTRSKKRRIFESREQGTRLLATSFEKLRTPPSVLISASAIGYYGNRAPAEAVDETAGRGSGFLADVVEAWERATDPARAAGVRVVNTRFAPVLSAKGGMLGMMLPIFRLGLGGRLGSGKQMWSWVTIDDVVASILFCLDHSELGGPVIVVAPQPVTNLAFTRTLGRVLRRPTIFGVPAFLLKLVLGEMAREMLLFGVRVVPRKLRQAGYAFKYPELEVALRHLLAAP